QRHNPKRQVESHDSETEFIEKQTCEIGIQVGKQLCEVGVQTSESIIQDLENYVILLQEQLNKKISEIEDLRKHLDCAYDYVVESWECDQKINKLSQELIKQNNDLLFKWENRFSNQEKRINSIIQIANKEQLYYLTPEMRTECESELNAYLLPILNELINEKRNESNTIDTIIKNQKGVGGHSKWCKKCNTTNIDNRKRTCPNCNEKLDTLAALRAESTNESAQI
ncbi:4213_t:CDS:2, partial [Gigaspora rosea]